MDSTSIITQVARDDEPLNAINTLSEKSHPNKSPANKKSRQTLFSTFFCCFSNSGIRLSNSSSSAHATPTSRHSTNQKPASLCNNNNNTTGSLVPSSGHLNSSTHTNCQTSSASPLAENRLSLVSDNKKYLLDPLRGNFTKKCVVIDLDETLVHSSFKPVNNADFIVPVEIEGTIHQVYVLKRPHVDAYLEKMGELFECILFTASLSKYADPVADLLDKKRVFSTRLFRESCVFYRGNYVKDLSRLGRNLDQVVIVDNSPASYFFHPDNAVAVASWFDDTNDTELLDLIPFFEKLSLSQTVYSLLKSANGNDACHANLVTPPTSLPPANHAPNPCSIITSVPRTVVTASGDYDNTYQTQ